MTRMTAAAWNDMKFFKPHEFSDADMMDTLLVYRLDSMRKYSGRKFIVHSSTGGKHRQNSTHYNGQAVDGHTEGLTILEQFLLAESFNWPGIGIYPFWPAPGVHLDSRSIELNQKGARWWRDKDGTYKAITTELIRSLE